jgi:hypothetical protein
LIENEAGSDRLDGGRLECAQSLVQASISIVEHMILGESADVDPRCR